MNADGPSAGPLLLACALRVEAQALRAGAEAARPQARLLRTGMGPQRARAGVGRALAQPEPAPSALVYTGFCASVRSGIRPADVLVATEVRDTVGTAAVFPQAERLAELLRGFGLSVHTGVLWSADHVVRGAERESLRRLGVAGVDMESAAALRAVPAGLPTAAVRVVVDTLNSNFCARTPW
ncbi:1-hydroxy-2-methyl-2-butenyl 4-diphosphate reductase [Streptacidiphilus monticola]